MNIFFIDETHLKQCILKLKEYREAGLRHFSSARMYDYLKQQRDKEKNHQRFLADVLQHLEVVCEECRERCKHLFNICELQVNIV